MINKQMVKVQVVKIIIIKGVVKFQAEKFYIKQKTKLLTVTISPTLAMFLSGGILWWPSSYLPNKFRKTHRLKRLWNKLGKSWKNEAVGT